MAPASALTFLTLYRMALFGRKNRGGLTFTFILVGALAVTTALVPRATFRESLRTIRLTLKTRSPAPELRCSLLPIWSWTGSVGGQVLNLLVAMT